MRKREGRYIGAGGRGLERAGPGSAYSTVILLLSAGIQGLPVPEVEDEVGDDGPGVC